MEAAITNKTGKEVAYVYHHVVLNPSTNEVIGLILGDCVYGKKPYPVGKFLRNTIRNANGEIVGLVKPEKLKPMLNDKEILSSAWQMLTKIQQYLFQWVPEKPVWAKEELNEYLLAN
jgi:hypothetical protein